MTHALIRRIPATCTRGFDFELRSAGNDGRTLHGYVAMFGSIARIPDRGGDFDEELHPGFADRSLAARGFPVMQFDHGKDPRVGTVPIGTYELFDRDQHGYAVRGRLFDNPVVEPVRQAIAGRAIKGMSFRFTVPDGGDRWTRTKGGDKRDIIDADMHEAGPVVFPAYPQTSVSVRSMLASLDDEQREALFAELAEQATTYIDLTDLTGRPFTRSGGGGDPDSEPWEGDASRNPHHARQRALALLRQPIVLPKEFHA